MSAWWLLQLLARWHRGILSPWRIGRCSRNGQEVSTLGICVPPGIVYDTSSNRDHLAQPLEMFTWLSCCAQTSSGRNGQGLRSSSRSLRRCSTLSMRSLRPDWQHGRSVSRVFHLAWQNIHGWPDHLPRFRCKPLRGLSCIAVCVDLVELECMLRAGGVCDARDGALVQTCGTMKRQ